MRTTFKDNPQQASIAGLKGAETRRKMKAYKEQHRAAMISKAEEIVSAFMDNKPVFGIDLKPELREKIIESVLTEVTIQSLVGALKHRDEVDLILLRHELTKSGNPITGVDGLNESGEQSDAPAMLTNAELMSLVGTQSEAKSRQSYDPLGGLPDLQDLPDLGDGDDDLFTGSSDGTLYFWENLAGPEKKYNFTSPITDYANIDAGSSSSPDFYDFDGDGDYDLALGKFNNQFLYFENRGTPQNPVFSEQQDLTQFGNIF